MKRVIGIGNALTDMLVNLKTDSVLGRFMQSWTQIFLSV